MPLIYPQPPAAARDALKRGLDSARSAQRGRAANDLTLADGTRLSKPIPVYTLPLARLKDGATASDARLAAWCYLLVAGEEIRQTADVLVAADGSCRFGGLSSEFTADAVAAFAKAGGLEEVAGRPYELRLLSVPTFHLLALWLKDTQGDEDRFIPLSPTPAGFDALAVYRAEELFGRLRPRAARKVEQNKKLLLR